MEDRTLKQLLMSSSYFVLNKQIVKTIGIEAGFLLTTLIEASDGLANDDGWFYKTAPSLEEETGLSNHKQSKIIEELTKLGILEQENKGMPMKRYFRINFQKIEELVFKIQDLKNSKPSIEENKKQGFKKFESKDLKNSNACIEKISNNKEYINNNLNKELNNIYIEAVDYLNEKAGTKYKTNSKNTTKHIQARIREGYTLEDFKTVIDKKCSEWLNTDMEKYLCPETLFGSKFEKYLNQKIIHKNIGILASAQETKKIKWGE